MVEDVNVWARGTNKILDANEININDSIVINSMSLHYNVLNVINAIQKKKC